MLSFERLLACAVWAIWVLSLGKASSGGALSLPAGLRASVITQGLKAWPLSLSLLSFIHSLACSVPGAKPKVCIVEPDMIPVLRTHMCRERE